MTENSPVIGSFLRILGEKEEIHFRDQDGNIHQVSDFDFLMPHATECEGSYHYPRPFVYDAEGNVIRQGEIGVVIFRNGDTRMPIWLGALRPGNWSESQFFHGYKNDDCERKVQRWETAKSLVEKIDDSDGDQSKQIFINQPLENEEIGDFAKRKKKLKKVITSSSSTSDSGTNLLKQAGLNDQFSSKEMENGAASKVPDGDYFSIRHFVQDENDENGQLPRGHFGVQVTNSGEVIIRLDQLLEGAVRAANELVGKGNVKVTILGSNPQGDREVNAAEKNGDVSLEYNGDLKIINKAQSVTGIGSDMKVKQNLHQEISTSNKKDEEKITIEQRTAKEQGTINSFEMAATKEHETIVIKSEIKEKVNIIVLDTGDKQKLEILNTNGKIKNTITLDAQKKNIQIQVSDSILTLGEKSINIETSEELKIKAKNIEITGETTITGNTEIKGGDFTTSQNSVTPEASGPFCAIANCLFTGTPHVGKKAN